MFVVFTPFDPNTIIPDGIYWIVTKKKYGNGYLSARVYQTDAGKMHVDVTNQTVLFISTSPCSIDAVTSKA
jgi:hypothetical protein